MALYRYAYQSVSVNEGSRIYTILSHIFQKRHRDALIFRVPHISQYIVVFETLDFAHFHINVIIIIIIN